MNDQTENDKLWEMLCTVSKRVDLLVQSLDVLGQLVKLQGERINKLEDYLQTR